MTNFTAMLTEYRTIAANTPHPEAIRAYWMNHHCLDSSHFEDSFEAEFDCESDVDTYLVDSFLEAYEVDTSNILSNYIDEDKVARDMRFDYDTVHHNDKVYLFRQC